MAKVIKAGLDAQERRTISAQVRGTVEGIVADIEARGDEAVRELSQKFDNWSPEHFRLSQQEIDAAIAEVPAADLEAIEFSLEQVRTFAAAQRRASPTSRSRPFPASRWAIKISPLPMSAAISPADATRWSRRQS